MTDVLGPLLQHAVRAGGPVDVRAIVAQMVQMGDEGHNRNRAGTLMFLREVLPAMIGSGFPASRRRRGGALRLRQRPLLPEPGDAGLQAADPGRRRRSPGRAVVTVMARNGTDFGIQTSGTGDRWFTAPANTPEGLFLGGYGPEDANPDIGDSAITETAGIGGMSMATAPAIVRFVGGSVPDALATTQRMYDITVGENPGFAIPILEFRGAPTAIDVTAVVRSGVLPQINTGMAGRVAGTGQVGAGLVTPPMACFTAGPRRARGRGAPVAAGQRGRVSRSTRTRTSRTWRCAREPSEPWMPIAGDGGAVGDVELGPGAAGPQPDRDHLVPLEAPGAVAVDDGQPVRAGDQPAARQRVATGVEHRPETDQGERSGTA